MTEALVSVSETLRIPAEVGWLPPNLRNPGDSRLPVKPCPLEGGPADRTETPDPEAQICMEDHFEGPPSGMPL